LMVQLASNLDLGWHCVQLSASDGSTMSDALPLSIDLLKALHQSTSHSAELDGFPKALQ